MENIKSLTIRLLKKEDEEQLQKLLKEQLFDTRSYVWDLLNQPKWHLVWTAFGLLCGFTLNSVLIGFVSMLTIPAVLFTLLYINFNRSTKDSFKDIHEGCFAHWTTKNRAMWVAVSDGQVLGSTAIEKREDNSAEVQRVVTDVKARGRGIARRLLRKVLVESKNMGITCLTLHTSPPLKAAIALLLLYTSEGFIKMSESKVFHGIITVMGFKKDLI